MRKLLCVCSVLLLIGCGGGGGGGLPPAAGDFSGSYFMIISGSPDFTLDVVQSGNAATFTMTGEGMNITGSGVVTGTQAIMTGTIPAFGADVTVVANFDDSGPTTTFTGSYLLMAGASVISDGTIMGDEADWTTYDLAVPKFVADDYIDLNDIWQLSLFRSSAGHDYSDSDESCRSMKHYFMPDPAIVDYSTIEIYSPVDGTVVSVTNEYHSGSPAGLQLTIESDDYPGIYFVIFHMDALNPINLGDTFTAGQQIGTQTTGQGSDIAVGVYTSGGWQLESFFDVMTDFHFNTNYATPNLAITDRTSLIHTESTRDSNPLTCNGEDFDFTPPILPDPLLDYLFLD